MAALTRSPTNSDFHEPKPPSTLRIVNRLPPQSSRWWIDCIFASDAPAQLALAWLALRYPLTDLCPFDILQRGPG